MSISDFYKSVEQALLEYFKAIDAQKLPGEKTPLRPHFERLDALCSDMPNDTDSQLRHYMKQKSYEKALRFVQGQSHLNQDGGCTR
jgi:hypothetical protein